MYVCMYVCVRVCVYIYKSIPYIYTYIHIHIGKSVAGLRDAEGMTLLHCAAREGHIELVRYLVSEVYLY